MRTDTPSSGTKTTLDPLLPPMSASAQSDKSIQAAPTRSSIPNSSKACSIQSPTFGHINAGNSDRKYILSLAQELPLQILSKAGEYELILCREEEDYLSQNFASFCPPSIPLELRQLVKKLLLVQRVVSFLPSHHSVQYDSPIVRELNEMFSDTSQLYVTPAELLLYIRESGLNYATLARQNVLNGSTAIQTRFSFTNVTTGPMTWTLIQTLLLSRIRNPR